VCARQARRAVHRRIRPVHLEVRRKFRIILVSERPWILRARTFPVRSQIRAGYFQLARHLQHRLPRFLVDPTQRLRQQRPRQLPIQRRYPSRAPVLRRLRSTLVSQKNLNVCQKLKKFENFFKKVKNLEKIELFFLNPEPNLNP
jgi:hypothetical protein